MYVLAYHLLQEVQHLLSYQTLPSDLLVLHIPVYLDVLCPLCYQQVLENPKRKYYIEINLAITRYGLGTS